MKRGPRRLKELSGQNAVPFQNRLATPHRGRCVGETLAAARRNYERYMARACEAPLKGDRIEMENSYQHAEHYLIVMKANRAYED